MSTNESRSSGGAQSSHSGCLHISSSIPSHVGWEIELRWATWETPTFHFLCCQKDLCAFLFWPFYLKLIPFHHEPRKKAKLIWCLDGAKKVGVVVKQSGRERYENLCPFHSSVIFVVGTPSSPPPRLTPLWKKGEELLLHYLLYRLKYFYQLCLAIWWMIPQNWTL